MYTKTAKYFCAWLCDSRIQQQKWILIGSFWCSTGPPNCFMIVCFSFVCWLLLKLNVPPEILFICVRQGGIWQTDVDVWILRAFTFVRENTSPRWTVLFRSFWLRFICSSCLPKSFCAKFCRCTNEQGKQEVTDQWTCSTIQHVLCSPAGNHCFTQPLAKETNHWFGQSSGPHWNFHTEQHHHDSTGWKLAQSDITLFDVFLCPHPSLCGWSIPSKPSTDATTPVSILCLLSMLDTVLFSTNTTLESVLCSVETTIPTSTQDTQKTKIIMLNNKNRQLLKKEKCFSTNQDTQKTKIIMLNNKNRQLLKKEKCFSRFVI